jgi:tRNA threonylcarbamoyladenosine biosynthesis protein TsaB
MATKPGMSDDKIIAVETSGRRGSVAIGLGGRFLGEIEFPTQVEHARELLPAIDKICRDQGWLPAEVRQCYLSVGPGSFTGLRVAVTFARHLALGVGAKVCAVPTLDVIARNCLELADPPPRLAVILDAKRDQVYAAIFICRRRLYEKVVGPCLAEPAALLRSASKPLAVIGEGADHHKVAVEQAGAEVLDRSLWWPRAANVHRLGWHLASQGLFTKPRELAPFYVRRPEAEELWERRHSIEGRASNAQKNLANRDVDGQGDGGESRPQTKQG